MPYAGLLDTQNIIINAIRDDVGAVAHVTVGDCTLPIVDEHDPLGLAFYTYALLETGYTNQELASFIDSLHYWVEEKLSEGSISPYTDRDLGAIGLIVFALCKHRSCPDVSGKFAPLAEKYFSDYHGLFDNFLATVLVALGLNKLPSETQLYPHLYQRFTKYINSQLRDNSHIVLNDAKNAVVAYIWADETNTADLLRILRQVCFNRASREDTHPRDLVYLTYVLFEEIENLPPDQKLKVKEWVEDSLRFIQTYSLEAGFSRDILDEFKEDVALAPLDVRRHYNYRVRPRLSRILVSIGHLIEQRYTSKPHLLLTEEQEKRQWQRVVVYPTFFILCTGLLLYVGVRFGLPLDAKGDIASKSVLPIMVAIIKVLVNAAWFIALSIGVILAGRIFQRIITAKDLDDRAALEYSWRKVKDILWGDIIASTLISVFMSLR
ncbi:MAG TPA: hypothetical protein VGX92_06035 [Pyrinomonadaceae bacterium]|jgi:hypothetical protein|nr:hypothetical protein [Pyrinomonadaceae bacterium]